MLAGPGARPGGSFQPASGGGSCHRPSYRIRCIPTFHTLHLAHVMPSVMPSITGVGLRAALQHRH